MPLSTAEKQRAYRQRRKSDPEKYKLDLKKAKERCRTRRNRLGTTKIRSENVAYQRRHRNKVKSSGKGYRTRQAMYKARCRVESVLPRSPTKRKEIIQKIAETSGISVSPSLQNFTVRPKLTDDTLDKIEKFYLRDDISRVAPGRRDRVIHREKGSKIYYQKRHLFHTLNETYRLFKEEYPNLKIGKTSFVSVRPVGLYVLPMGDMPHEVCICQKHANFIEMVEKLAEISTIN